ncbi:MAG: hypothetical protein D6714_10990 [Bacteroidetes bacterium]|nr:MAG: hypothetical protein D6714_10990 [Bacteroidota bacterium]
MSVCIYLNQRFFFLSKNKKKCVSGGRAFQPCRRPKRAYFSGKMRTGNWAFAQASLNPPTDSLIIFSRARFCSAHSFARSLRRCTAPCVGLGSWASISDLRDNNWAFIRFGKLMTS